MRLKKLIAGIGCLLLAHMAKAQTIQQVIATGGGSSTALPGYTVDFTIGETVILTGGTIPACTEGFQQPTTTGSIKTGTTKTDTTKTDTTATPPNWVINIYPNPIHDQLTIHAYMDRAGEVSYSLFDILGHQILTGRLSFQQGYNDALIDVGTITPAIYILYLFDATNNKYHAMKLLKE